MTRQMAERFQEHFGKMTDPRVERTKLYPWGDFFVMLCGSICGAESWRDFVMFGGDKLDFLREYFPFKEGIPCKNTFARVSAALERNHFAPVSSRGWPRYKPCPAKSSPLRGKPCATVPIRPTRRRRSTGAVPLEQTPDGYWRHKKGLKNPISYSIRPTNLRINQRVLNEIV
jgi:hypothetical protein